uniref:Rab-GAP TBC domain-containing protein n=1 Tax=Chromera velia CCMP2878 TaxID=1169474 RepID=A0A0G4HDX9_9ALVE|eukprot:Cvel_6429.t1-p1 / transcript=Cvel_6429.t1 / gene=Cvel_6429 / organism=Chromera_velia_CCMP2878 / gene_product=TBC1 domain family member 14, putative / transcript_product=TBC1 domain family member 14, putative / location=Cvel_scaffold314:88298-99195(+) / protein_length=2119 / sequence_SO=supercontig / SO=protein_coding / is_pseudo=false
MIFRTLHNRRCTQVAAGVNSAVALLESGEILEKRCAIEQEKEEKKSKASGGLMRRGSSVSGRAGVTTADVFSDFLQKRKSEMWQPVVPASIRNLPASLGRRGFVPRHPTGGLGGGSSAVCFSSIACGGTFVLAVSREGVLFSWGESRQGALGLGPEWTQRHCANPRVVSALEGRRVTSISCGFLHAVALTREDPHSFFSWGCTADGRLCNCLTSGPDVAAPRKIPFVRQFLRAGAAESRRASARRPLTAVAAGQRVMSMTAASGLSGGTLPAFAPAPRLQQRPVRTAWEEKDGGPSAEVQKGKHAAASSGESLFLPHPETRLSAFLASSSRSEGHIPGDGAPIVDVEGEGERPGEGGLSSLGFEGEHGGGTGREGGVGISGTVEEGNHKKEEGRLKFLRGTGRGARGPGRDVKGGRGKGRGGMIGGLRRSSSLGDEEGHGGGFSVSPPSSPAASVASSAVTPPFGHGLLPDALREIQTEVAEDMGELSMKGVGGKRRSRSLGEPSEFLREHAQEGGWGPAQTRTEGYGMNQNSFESRSGAGGSLQPEPGGERGAEAAGSGPVGFAGGDSEAAVSFMMPRSVGALEAGGSRSPPVPGVPFPSSSLSEAAGEAGGERERRGHTEESSFSPSFKDRLRQRWMQLNPFGPSTGAGGVGGPPPSLGRQGGAHTHTASSHLRFMRVTAAGQTQNNSPPPVGVPAGLYGGLPAWKVSGSSALSRSRGRGRGVPAYAHAMARPLASTGENGGFLGGGLNASVPASLSPTPMQSVAQFLGGPEGGGRRGSNSRVEGGALNQRQSRGGGEMGESRRSLGGSGFGSVRVKKVVCGFDHTLILLSDGDLWACGSDHLGQLGSGSGGFVRSPVPRRVQIERCEGEGEGGGKGSRGDVVDATAGPFHSLALCSDGSVFVFGLNVMARESGDFNRSSSAERLLEERRRRERKSSQAPSACAAASAENCQVVGEIQDNACERTETTKDKEGLPMEGSSGGQHQHQQQAGGVSSDLSPEPGRENSCSPPKTAWERKDILEDNKINRRPLVLQSPKLLCRFDLGRVSDVSLGQGDVNGRGRGRSRGSRNNSNASSVNQEEKGQTTKRTNMVQMECGPHFILLTCRATLLPELLSESAPAHLSAGIPGEERGEGTYDDSLSGCAVEKESVRRDVQLNSATNGANGELGAQERKGGEAVSLSPEKGETIERTGTGGQEETGTPPRMPRDSKKPTKVSPSREKADSSRRSLKSQPSSLLQLQPASLPPSRRAWAHQMKEKEKRGATVSPSGKRAPSVEVSQKPPAARLEPPSRSPVLEENKGEDRVDKKGANAHRDGVPVSPSSDGFPFLSASSPAVSVSVSERVAGLGASPSPPISHNSPPVATLQQQQQLQTASPSPSSFLREPEGDGKLSEGGDRTPFLSATGGASSHVGDGIEEGGGECEGEVPQQTLRADDARMPHPSTPQPAFNSPESPNTNARPGSGQGTGPQGDDARLSPSPAVARQSLSRTPPWPSEAVGPDPGAFLAGGSGMPGPSRSVPPPAGPQGSRGPAFLSSQRRVSLASSSKLPVGPSCYFDRERVRQWAFWETQVIPEWLGRHPGTGGEIGPGETHRGSTIEKAWRQGGVPAESRDVVWPLAIGNRMRITRQLFETLTEAVEIVRKKKAKQSARETPRQQQQLPSLCPSPSVPSHAPLSPAPCSPPAPALSLFPEKSPVSPPVQTPSIEAASSPAGQKKIELHKQKTAEKAASCREQRAEECEEAEAVNEMKEGEENQRPRKASSRSRPSQSAPQWRRLTRSETVEIKGRHGTLTRKSSGKVGKNGEEKDKPAPGQPPFPRLMATAVSPNATGALEPSADEDQNALNSPPAAAPFPASPPTPSPSFTPEQTGEERETEVEVALSPGEKSLCASLRLIEVDLPRTLPHLGLFGPRGSLYHECRDILAAWAAFRPDLGYVQGMSYIAAVLLLHLPPGAAAFSALCNLVTLPVLCGMYKLGIEEVESRYRIFYQLLDRICPPMRMHLEDIGLPCELFLLEWFLTLFSKVLPLPFACLVWDLLLLDGEITLFVAAVLLLDLSKQAILTAGDVAEGREALAGVGRIATQGGAEGFLQAMRRVRGQVQDEVLMAVSRLSTIEFSVKSLLL